jgi:predicted transcriptional regulator YheO
VIGSIFGFRLIPAYLQNSTINNTFKVIAHDPEMQKASIQEIRNSFSKRASIDNMTAIKPEDIDVSTDDGQLVLSASYSVTVPLVANASLVLDFKPSSAQ